MAAEAAGPFSVAWLAEQLGGTVEGDAERLLVGVRGLEDAGPEHLSFLSNRRYVRLFRKSAAGCVLVGRKDDSLGRTVIRLADPYEGFARALGLFHPAPTLVPGVDPQAHVDPTAVVDGARVEGDSPGGLSTVRGAASLGVRPGRSPLSTGAPRPAPAGLAPLGRGPRRRMGGVATRCYSVVD